MQPNDLDTAQQTAAEHARSALVTGGSKGIGLAIAQALVKQGYGVTITARRREQVEEAAGGLGPQALGVTCDVRDPQELEEAVRRHLARFGGLNVLIANAGVGHFAPVQDMTLEQWREVIDTNLSGVFYSVRACVDELAKSRGYVVTLSSLAGKNPFAGGAAYNASKFGLNGFTEAIMLDLRALGIKVTQIMPGSVATHFNGHTPSPEADAWKIQPEDLAQIVVDVLELPERTLPSRIEVRPAQPKRG